MKESEASIVCSSCFDNWVTVTYYIQSTCLFERELEFCECVRSQNVCQIYNIFFILRRCLVKYIQMAEPPTEQTS